MALALFIFFVPLKCVRRSDNIPHGGGVRFSLLAKGMTVHRNPAIRKVAVANKPFVSAHIMPCASEGDRHTKEFHHAD